MSTTAPETTCYRHPSRETGVSCSSCGRPICPDCMTPTPVGMRCPECSAQKTKVRTVSSISGGVPAIAQAIIAICVVAWIAELATSHSDYTVLQRGGLIGPFMADNNQWYRIVTSGFLHDDRMPGGLLHIGFNMYLLYFLAQQLEPRLGRVRFALAYVVCLLGGSAGALLLSPDSLTVGASGAVFGLIGMGLMDYWSRGISPMQSPLGGLLVLNILLSVGFNTSISLGGHLGGLAAGAALGYLFFILVPARRELRQAALPLTVALGVALAIASIAIAGAS